jgi:hypothetical protein
MGQVLDEKFRGTWTCLNYQDLVVFSEKYMELVVQECAGWVNDNVGLINEEAKADLLKHFGVDEE